MQPLIVDTYPELIALHKALLRVRFANPTVDPLLSASPHLANIAIKIVDLLAEHETTQNRLNNRIDNWHIKIVPNEEVWSIAIRNVIEACGEFWNDWSSEDKMKNAKIFLAPFAYSEQILEQFITEITNQLN